MVNEIISHREDVLLSLACQKQHITDHSVGSATPPSSKDDKQVPKILIHAVPEICGLPASERKIYILLNYNHFQEEV